jgi:ABC-type transporter Mla subunit MlaD
MGDTEDERSILDALDPGGEEAVSPEEERSILEEINHIREHIEVLEDAARAARAVEFEQIRRVVEQLEAVAAAARAVESDLARELANTNRMSVATARIVRDRLATALRALAEVLVTEESDRKARKNRDRK